MDCALGRHVDRSWASSMVPIPINPQHLSWSEHRRNIPCGMGVRPHPRLCDDVQHGHDSQVRSKLRHQCEGRRTLLRHAGRLEIGDSEPTIGWNRRISWRSADRSGLVCGRPCRKGPRNNGSCSNTHHQCLDGCCGGRDHRCSGRSRGLLWTRYHGEIQEHFRSSHDIRCCSDYSGIRKRHTGYSSTGMGRPVGCRVIQRSRLCCDRPGDTSQPHSAGK